MAPLDRDSATDGAEATQRAAAGTMWTGQSGLLFDVRRDAFRSRSRPMRPRPCEPTTMLDAPSARAASMTQVAGSPCQIEDVRAERPRRGHVATIACRVVLARSASLVDPLAEPASRQPQPAGVDRVDDDERHVGLERHPDRDPLRGEGHVAEVGREDDRSRCGRGSPGADADDRHAHDRGRAPQTEDVPDGPSPAGRSSRTSDAA